MPLELDTSRTCQSWLCCKVQPQSLGLLAFVLANRCTVAGTLYEYLSVSCTVLLLALERTSLELLVGYQLVIAKKCKNVVWAQRTGAAIKQSQKFGRSNFCVFKGSQKTLNFFHARTWGHLSTWACCSCVLPSNCVECGGIAVDIKSGQIQMKQGRAGFWDFNILYIYSLYYHHVYIWFNAIYFRIKVTHLGSTDSTHKIWNFDNEEATFKEHETASSSEAASLASERALCLSKIEDFKRAKGDLSVLSERTWGRPEG